MNSIMKRTIKECEVNLDGFREFMFGGNAEFTVENTETGRATKYHVRANSEGSLWFIYVCVSGTKYTYAGFMRLKGTTYYYDKGSKGNYDYEDSNIKVLFYLLRNGSKSDPRVHVLHHGKCAVCGRALRDSESIQWGIGPSCRKKVLSMNM